MLLMDCNLSCRSYGVGHGTSKAVFNRQLETALTFKAAGPFSVVSGSLMNGFNLTMCFLKNQGFNFSMLLCAPLMLNAMAQAASASRLYFNIKFL